MIRPVASSDARRPARRPRISRAVWLGFAMGAASGGAHAQDTILPGYWETTDHVMGASKVERRCVLPRDIAKVMSGPSNHIYKCAYPTNTVGGGHIAFRGACVDRKGRRFELSGRGEYTHTTLTMSALVTGHLLGVPLSLTASTDAHRLGDACPPGAPGSEQKARAGGG